MGKNRNGLIANDANIISDTQTASLRAAITAGLKSGPGWAADVVFDRLELKYQNLLDDQKQN